VSRRSGSPLGILKFVRDPTAFCLNWCSTDRACSRGGRDSTARVACGETTWLRGTAGRWLFLQTTADGVSGLECGHLDERLLPDVLECTWCWPRTIAQCSSRHIGTRRADDRLETGKQLWRRWLQSVEHVHVEQRTPATSLEGTGSGRRRRLSRRKKVAAGFWAPVAGQRVTEEVVERRWWTVDWWLMCDGTSSQRLLVEAKRLARRPRLPNLSRHCPNGQAGQRRAFPKRRV
jgi:hypothetical protein